MRSAGRRVFFGKLAFDVCDNVYEPAEDSFLFAENLHVNAGLRVLDVGTGSGILGLIAAERGAEVLALDVNPFAVRCARQNAKLNSVNGKLSFLQGDLFTPLSQTAAFDLILFNSPYLPSEAGEEASWIGRAWAGGASGRQVIDRFIRQSPAHLQKTGKILLLQSTLSDVEASSKLFRSSGLKSEIVAERKLPFFETLVLLKATFAGF